MYTEMADLIQQYIDEGKSWKYTSVLLNEGSKEYIGSTVDGDGNEIHSDPFLGSFDTVHCCHFALSSFFYCP